MSELIVINKFTGVTFPVGEGGLHRRTGSSNTAESICGVIIKHERKNEHSERCHYPKRCHSHMFNYMYYNGVSHDEWSP